jgi:hypothetical protein
VRLADAAATDASHARAYLAAFAEACEHALHRAGAFSHELAVGSRRVCLQFAGDALEKLLFPALSHLRVASADAASGPRDLTIQCWDGASTGVFPPRFPWRGADVRARGEIRGYNQDGVRTLFHGGIAAPGGDFVALTMFDELTRVARFFVVRPEVVPWYERAAPLRTALHWGLRDAGRLLVHAGAIGSGGRGVLLVGPGGSGKSTTAVAALLDGLDYLGDDYVVLDLAAAEPVAHSLYCTAKLTSEAFGLLPELANPAWPASGDKHVLDVSPLRGADAPNTLKITAVVLPRLGRGGAEGAVHLRPVKGGDGLLALAPSTIFQAPSERAALAPLARLIRTVPSYVLELGGRPGDAVAALAQLLPPDARA